MSEIADGPIFLHVGKVQQEPDWSNTQITHEYHELIIIIDGRMTVTGCDRENHILEAGDAAIYPAQVYHREKSDPAHPVLSYYIAFSGPLSYDAISINRHSSEALRPLVTLMYGQHLDNAPAEVMNSFTALLLAVFHRHMDANSAIPMYVHIADHFMHKHLAEPLKLEDIAGAAQMSKFHFLRNYKRDTGSTPFEKLNELRCREGIALLQYTSLSNKEIAIRTGFADSCHFTKKIKAYSGKTPTELRKKQVL